MFYMKVLWRHNMPNEPVELYSELDDGRYEVRKVEIFGDGRRYFADSQRSSGTTVLGEGPLPTFEEIAEQEEFSPTAISCTDFENVWRRALEDAKGS